MGIGAVAATRLWMAQPGTPILSDWVEIKNTVNLGDVMRQFAAINVEEIGNPVTYSMKGTENFPNFAVTLNRNNTDPGQIALKAAASSREVLYNFRVEDPDGGLAATGTFTVTIASPGVFTAVSPATHGLNIGDRVKLSTTGALPTGLVAGTTYYVIAAGFTTSAFQLSTTAGGAAIVTTGTQSGTHTYTEIPLGSTKDWKGEVFGFGTGYGGPNNLRQVKTEISFRPETFVETLAP